VLPQVHHDDVVGLLDQLFGKGETHFTVSYNDNVHKTGPFQPNVVIRAQLRAKKTPCTGVGRALAGSDGPLSVYDAHQIPAARLRIEDQLEGAPVQPVVDRVGAGEAEVHKAAVGIGLAEIFQGIARGDDPV